MYAHVHAGNFICGVVEDPVPQFVAYGKSIERAKQLMLASKGIRINQTVTFFCV